MSDKEAMSKYMRLSSAVGAELTAEWLQTNYEYEYRPRVVGLILQAITKWLCPCTEDVDELAPGIAEHIKALCPKQKGCGWPSVDYDQFALYVLTEMGVEQDSRLVTWRAEEKEVTRNNYVDYAPGALQTEMVYRLKAKGYLVYTAKDWAPAEAGPEKTDLCVIPDGLLSPTPVRFTEEELKNARYILDSTDKLEKYVLRKVKVASVDNWINDQL